MSIFKSAIAIFSTVGLVSCAAGEKKEDVQVGLVPPDWQEQRIDLINKVENRVSDIESNVNGMQVATLPNKAERKTATRSLARTKNLISEVKAHLNEGRHRVTPDTFNNWKDRITTGLNRLDAQYEVTRDMF